MKKLIALILALTMVLSLCSCGRRRTTLSTEPTTEATTESTTEATTEATTEPTTEPITEPTAETNPIGVPGTVINADSLNVREKPGTNYKLVTTLKRGSVVEIFEQTAIDGNVWGRTANGWVNMQYIALNHTHSYTKKVTQPTCTTRGYTTYTCICGDTYEDDHKPTTGHTWSDWVVTKEPTTSSKGVSKRSCAICGETETKELDKLIDGHTHSYTFKITREPTCATVGIKTYTCSCGSTYIENIDRVAHKYKDKVTAPTCTSRGYTTHTCTVCGSSYADTYTPAGKHQYTVKVVEPTCTAPGYTTHSCNFCGDTYKDHQTAALGHSYGEWITTKAPTATETGTAVRICSRCGHSDSKALPKLEDTKPTEHIHNWGLWTNVPHTCTVDGYDIRSCKTCSETQTRNSYDPAPGHSYQVVGSKSPTCTEDGSVTYQCTVCGDSYTEAVPAAHTWEHHHVDAVYREEVRFQCNCGQSFSSEDAWGVHWKEMWDSGDVTHSFSSHLDKILVEPAKDWDECTVCGATK